MYWFKATCIKFYIQQLWQAVSPALQQLIAILIALDLPQPTKDSTVFDLFSQIENKVSQYQHLWLILVYSCSYYYLIYHFLVIITEVKKIILINQ